MADRLLEKLKYQFVKVMTTLTLAGAPAAAAAQHTSPEQHDGGKPDVEVLHNSSLENGTVRQADFSDSLELNKTGSFEELRTVPWVISNELNTEYVMSLKKWRESDNNNEVEIKRAHKDQVAGHDLTTVMELRESDSAGDAVNLNKSRTRMFICQGSTVCGKDFVRMLYFSKNEDLREFAEKYIGRYIKPQQKSSPQTAEEAAKKVYELLYDEHGSLKLGAESRKERRQAFQIMRCFSTKDINSGSKFTDEFIDDFKDLDKKNHTGLMQAEKDYSVGFYNLENSCNIPARKAAAYAQKHGLRNASCIPVGLAGLDISALIAHGPYSMSGFSPRDKKEAKQFQNAARVNKADYVTLECVRQMALAGYDGALEMYNAFSAAVSHDRKKIQERANDLMPEQTVKPDVIKRTQLYIPETPNKKLSPEEIHIRINKLHGSGSR